MSGSTHRKSRNLVLCCLKSLFDAFLQIRLRQDNSSHVGGSQISVIGETNTAAVSDCERLQSTDEWSVYVSINDGRSVIRRKPSLAENAADVVILTNQNAAWLQQATHLIECLDRFSEVAHQKS